MGIKGLWQALKPYVQDGHLGQFRGQRVAVDMYVLLHSATYGCVMVNEAALAAYFTAKHTGAAGPGASSPLEPIRVEEAITLSDQYIDKVVQRIESLQRYGVIPVCVFDGADVPMKHETNITRQAGRDQSFQEALMKLEENFLRAGGGRGFQRSVHSYREAVDLLAKAVDISPEVAHPVIQALREERHLECIVAPYEADPQLAYLVQSGYVRAALSEDSDLIAYYCPCVIAKVEFFSGRCSVLFPAESVPTFFRSMATTGTSNGTGIGGSHRKSSYSSSCGATTISTPSGVRMQAASAVTATTATTGPSSFTYESFLLGCVMSGCDYVANLKQVGIKKAFRLVAHSQSLPELLACLRDQYGFPAETVKAYRRSILEAFYCFAHHIVYCPLRKAVAHLHPLPANVAGAGTPKTELVGELWPADVARRVCEECLLDPTTRRMYKGTYLPALQAYLRRTRRGQVPLTDFAAFQGRSSAKVVTVGEKRSREGEVVTAAIRSDIDKDSQTSGLGKDLQRVKAVHGFLGSGSKATTAASITVAVGPRTLVRSKYFLRPDGRQAVAEDWSASEEADDSIRSASSGRGEAQKGVSPDSHDNLITMRAESQSDGLASHSLATPALSERTLATELPPAMEGGQVCVTTTATAGANPALVAAAAPATCACPFSYSQCNTAHSIFYQCFAGKNWTRGEMGGATADTGSPLLAASSLASPARSRSLGGASATPSHHNREQAKAETPVASSTYRCAGFRPPRSLGQRSTAYENPAPATKAPSKSSKRSNSSDSPAEGRNEGAAALFDKLAFRRA